MQFNTTRSKAFNVFTLEAGGYSGAIGGPLLISNPGISLSSPSIWSTVVGFTMILLSVYLYAVRYFRYQHINKIQQKYGRAPVEFSKINYKDAQAILGSLFLLDSPWIFQQAKDFAFLRAFGIPSISTVSVKAKKMVDQPGLRYSDTIVFASEWIMNPLDSERARLSLNRVNFIHSRYRDITNDQMVYTLCLLVSETLRWVDTYDWRKTTPLEKYASWVFWKEVGIRMGIAEKLIPGSFEECAQYVLDYETREMAPSDANSRIAQGIVDMYNSVIPSFFRPIFSQILTSFMDTQLRTALGLPEPNRFIISAVFFALHARSLFVKHCMLPRYNLPKVFHPNKDGSTSVIYWMMQPWYAPVTFWNRWGPVALYSRVFGLPIPGKDWAQGGYRLESVGYGGRGADKVLEVMERAKEGGCPYSTFGMVKNEAELGGIYAQFAAGSGCPFGH